MSTASPIIVQLGDAEVRVPPEAAARAYIEQLLTQSRPLEILHAEAVPAHLAPAIGQDWHGQGGVYAGIARGAKDGEDFHVIVPRMPKLKANHEDAIKHAREVEVDGHRDFELLNKAVAPICFGNVPELFEKDWHWMADTQDAAAGCAWIQDFTGGSQLWGRKDFRYLVRAFRRLPIR
jgi:hypothetical protein